MRTHSLLCRWWWLAPVGILALVLAGRGKDAAQLPVPGRNLVNTTDKNVLLDFSFDEGSEKNILWKAQLGTSSYAGPVIAGGKVFVCTNNEHPRDPKIAGDAGVVLCFDAKSGNFLWQAVHEKLADNAQNNPHLGIASTPFVEGDRLYYVSNRCELVCADVNGDPKNPGKARIIWSLDMIGELKVFPSQLASSSPTVYGDLVFAVTSNGWNVEPDSEGLPRPEAPSFVAVDKKTGKVKWTDASPGKNIMEGQWTSPTIAVPKGGKAQAIFPGGDGWLYSFEAETGKLLWKFNGNPKSAVFSRTEKRLSHKAYFVAPPVVWEDRVYIAVGRNPDEGTGVGHLWCIALNKTGDVSPVDDIFDANHPKNKNSALVWHHGGRIDPEPTP